MSQKNISGNFVRDIQAQFNLKAKSTCKCYYCKREISWKEKHVEHKQPLSRSGSNNKSNLAVSCAKCNLSKGSKTEEEFLEFLGAMAAPIGWRFSPHAQCSSKSFANREAAAL